MYLRPPSCKGCLYSYDLCSCGLYRYGLQAATDASLLYKFVCMRTRVPASEGASIHTCVHECVRACMRARECMRACGRACLRLHTQGMCRCAGAGADAWVRGSVDAWLRGRVCLHACVHGPVLAWMRGCVGAQGALDWSPGPSSLVSVPHRRRHSTDPVYWACVVAHALAMQCAACQTSV